MAGNTGSPAQTSDSTGTVVVPLKNKVKDVDKEDEPIRDAYIVETGNILLDFISLQLRTAAKDKVQNPT